jgi:hypothetical protein
MCCHFNDTKWREYMSIFLLHVLHCSVLHGQKLVFPVHLWRQLNCWYLKQYLIKTSNVYSGCTWCNCMIQQYFIIMYKIHGFYHYFYIVGRYICFWTSVYSCYGFFCCIVVKHALYHNIVPSSTSGSCWNKYVTLGYPFFPISLDFYHKQKDCISSTMESLLCIWLKHAMELYYGSNNGKSIPPGTLDSTFDYTVFFSVELNPSFLVSKIFSCINERNFL